MLYTPRRRGDILKDGYQMKRTAIKAAVILLMALLLVLSSACSIRGQAADPGTWGYDCLVTYDALGGQVNAREVRKTYYLPNSYVFRPSGSSNMLVEPTRDGYILAGWYTAKSDAPEGSFEEYAFAAADRWDFNLDHVQEDMTLYTRWLPRSKVQYIDAETGDIIFEKNITGDSPVQELSDAVLKLNKPKGKTLYGYYADVECTTPYDFAAYQHVDPCPSEQELYAALFEQFPQYLEQAEYVAPDPDEETDETADMSYLFLNKLGYRLLTEDESALAELRAAKDQIIQDAIENYLITTAECNVYLKFTEGNFISVGHANDLKLGGKFGFFSEDAEGNPIDGYIFEDDIDLAGVSLTMSERFSGVIHGNGHTISNLTVSAMSKKIDNDKSKDIGLTLLMEGATINDLTFKDSKITLSVNPGIRVNGGLIAVEAKDCTFNNCHFDGLAVTGGKGDDGAAKYALGDLFGSYSNVTFNNCTAGELVADLLAPEKLRLAIFVLPEPEETPAP